MNVAMDRHRHEGEEDPNRVVGEGEADGIGIEGEIGIGETDQGILVGQKEVEGEVVLDGANVLGHESFPRSRLLLLGLASGGVVVRSDS